MSQSDDEFQEILALLETINTTTYVEYCAACLVAYEFVITFAQEVSVVWGRKFTATSLLLLGVRWVMVVAPIITIVPWPDTWCPEIYFLNGGIFIASTALVAIFSALRVYALWRDSRFRHLLTVIVFLLSAVPVATNIFGMSRTVAANLVLPPYTEICTDAIHVSPKVNEALLYFTRSSVIAADVLVLVLTWARSFRQFREMRALKLSSSVTTVLLRDGTVYFLTLLIMNILLLVTFTASGLSEGGQIDTVLQVMPPVLVQRFMLNLRGLNRTADSTHASDRGLPSASVAFVVPSGFLGNIGEPLDHGEDGMDFSHERNDFLHEEVELQDSPEEVLTDREPAAMAGTSGSVGSGEPEALLPA